MTETVALLKPDVVAAGKDREVMQLIELEGFTILEKKQLRLSGQTAKAFYSEHADQPFYNDLVAFMTSGPMWALLLTADDAVTKWRDLMGPTSTTKAREHAPFSLRALYGTDGTRNATHGSDSAAAARREVKFFFPKHAAALGPDDVTSEALCGQLEQTLCKGLTALAREKPAHDSTGALTWLADWLLQHNPNKPRIVGAADLALTDLDDEADFRAAIEQERAAEQRELDEAAIKVQSAFRGHQGRREVVAKRRAAADAANAPPAAAPEPKEARASIGAHSQASGRPSQPGNPAPAGAEATEENAVATGRAEVPVMFAHPGDGAAAEAEAAVAASTVQAAVRERLSAAEAAAVGAPTGSDEATTEAIAPAAASPAADATHEAPSEPAGAGAASVDEPVVAPHAEAACSAVDEPRTSEPQADANAADAAPEAATEPQNDAAERAAVALDEPTTAGESVAPDAMAEACDDAAQAPASADVQDPALDDAAAAPAVGAAAEEPDTDAAQAGPVVDARGADDAVDAVLDGPSAAAEQEGDAAPASEEQGAA